MELELQGLPKEGRKGVIFLPSFLPSFRWENGWGKLLTPSDDLKLISRRRFVGFFKFSVRCGGQIFYLRVQFAKSESDGGCSGKGGEGGQYSVCNMYPGKTPLVWDDTGREGFFNYPKIRFKISGCINSKVHLMAQVQSCDQNEEFDYHCGET